MDTKSAGLSDMARLAINCGNHPYEDERICPACGGKGHVPSGAVADDLPTEDEALAYATGYVAGLDAARDQNVAQLIKERDVAEAKTAFERALRTVFERRCNDLAVQIADLESKAKDWKDRWQAERSDHEASIKHCEEMLNAKR